MSRTLSIDGMSCGHCKPTVEEALEAVADVNEAAADLETQQATVEGDADPDDLVDQLQTIKGTASND